MDEFTERRLAKAQADRVLAAANEAIDRRYTELQPHGLAIVELLHATAIAIERIKEGARDKREFHLAQVVHVISTVLGVSDADSAAILKRIYQQES